MDIQRKVTSSIFNLFLKEVTLIDADTEDKVLKSLLTAYTAVKTDKYHSTMYSVINSCYTQRQSAFLFTRDSLKELLSNDSNTRFNSLLNEDYPKCIKFMSKSLFSFSRAKREADGREVFIVSIKDVELMTFLGLSEKDKRDQIEQIKEYVSSAKKAKPKGFNSFRGRQAASVENKE